jgi:hypothetical protein
MLHLIESMNTVSLAELDQVALQNRIDNKYVLTAEQLSAVLPLINRHYKVLEIDGCKIFSYENNYFDTKDLQFYYDHHNGYGNRLKVRGRKYKETDTSFFEIKRKEKIDRTAKTRERTTNLISEIDEAKKKTIQSFSRKHIADLEIILNNKFNRITFVNTEQSERMTLDFNIQYSDGAQEKTFSDFYVLEIKQPKSNGRSIITDALKKSNIREQSFSKYIFGIIALKEHIRKNNFLPLIKKINNL